MVVASWDCNISTNGKQKVAKRPFKTQKYAHTVRVSYTTGWAPALCSHAQKPDDKSTQQ